MDNVQHQRLELKYVIHERVALAVRDFVSSYLTLDEFGVGQPDLSYPIHSLYLDSDNFALYWQGLNGDKNRYKLRLRYYDGKPTTPVFFEIKRRMNNTILKDRGAVKREAVNTLLAGQLPEPEQLFFADEADQLPALEDFCRLMQHHLAKPKGHVAYRREAWVGLNDHSARVTFDRQIQYAPNPNTFLPTEMSHPFRLFGNEVVLELKFTGRFPDWFGDLVRCFNLQQGSAAKYIEGVTAATEADEDFQMFSAAAASEAQEKFRFRSAFLKNQTIQPEPA